MMNDINTQYKEICTNMAAACKNAGRASDDVTLVAVSKRQDDARIQAVLDAGHRVFGENKVQEAQEHWHDERRRAYPDLRLHLIGPLQTNKAKDAVALFDVIETLDRPKLADKLARAMDDQGVQRACFIQVNTGEEPQKSGVLPADLKDFYEYAAKECGLNVTGLMCIPPIDEPAGLHFGLLKRLAERLGLSQVSMGMSNDYETAIGFGATHIRVGSALFGPRQD